MANNKEPIAKKCRSLDISPAVMGYGNKKSNRNPGGNKRKKVSEYGTQLKEKQKVKFVYGVLEKQFHRYYVKAANMKGITGENLLKLLELRLDNVIYRLGLAKTRRMARQIVVHGHILVNGKKELKALTIQPEAVDPQDVEMLQDLVISAVNEALRQADEAMSNSMNSLTGGLNIPGLL